MRLYITFLLILVMATTKLHAFDESYHFDSNLIEILSVSQDGVECSKIIHPYITENISEDGDFEHNFQLPSNIIYNPYDKYDVNQPTLLPVFRESEYTPLLETGKEWRYVIVGAKPFEDGVEIRREEVWKLEAPVEIDGNQYYKVANHDVWLREDSQEGKVWCRVNDVSREWIARELSYGSLFDQATWEFENPGEEFPNLIEGDEYLLYDFQNPLDGIIAYGWSPSGTAVVVKDGVEEETPSYHDQRWNGDFAIVEGLGIIATKIDYTHYIDNECTFLLGQVVDRTCSYPTYMPFLYEVVDGSGNIIYKDTNITLEWSGMGMIANDDSPENVYDFQGRKLQSASRPGIFIKAKGGTAKKVMTSK